jgi:hypothetical protein
LIWKKASGGWVVGGWYFCTAEERFFSMVVSYFKFCPRKRGVTGLTKSAPIMNKFAPLLFATITR